MADDYEGRIRARREPHPFDGKLESLYNTLNQIKASNAQDAAQPPPEVDPQQVQMQQMQMQQMQAGQQAMQQNAIMQQAMQRASQMDPLARHRMAEELRHSALMGDPNAQDYRLSNQALVAKDYPNAFGDLGGKVQQILLASGMLNERPTTQSSYHHIRNYLQ